MLGMNFPKLFQRDVSSYVCGILYLDPSASLKRIFAFPVGGLFRPSTCLSTCSRSLFFTAAHFQLALVAASICHFVTAATKFSCCSVPTKNVSFLFFVCLSVFFFLFLALDLFRPFPRRVSLACRLLSLFLRLSLALYSKFVDITINLSLILQKTRIQKQFPLSVFVFIDPLTSSALQDEDGYAIFRQNKLELHLGCHT